MMASRSESKRRQITKMRNNYAIMGHQHTGANMPLGDLLREAEKLEITPGMKLKWSDELNKMVWEKE